MLSEGFESIWWKRFKILFTECFQNSSGDALWKRFKILSTQCSRIVLRAFCESESKFFPQSAHRMYREHSVEVIRNPWKRFRMLLESFESSVEAIRNSFHRVLAECSESILWKRFEIVFIECSQNLLVMLCGSDSKFFPQNALRIFQ